METDLRKYIGNRLQLNDKFIDDPQYQSPLNTMHLGLAAGSERLYASVDRLKPGAKSCKYHCHTQQEEFFLILRGRCQLRLGERLAGERLEEIYPMSQGDYFCKPAGRDIAHQFINDSDDIVEILDVGLNEPGDVAFYPDEGVTYVRNERKACKDGLSVDNWSSDPN